MEFCVLFVGQDSGGGSGRGANLGRGRGFRGGGNFWRGRGKFCYPSRPACVHPYTHTVALLSINWFRCNLQMSCNTSKATKVAYAPCKDSDQPGHLPLIPEAKADLSFHWLLLQLCWFCCVWAQIL